AEHTGSHPRSDARGQIESGDSLQPRKYLVTGGTGFIGSALVGALARSGALVRVLDNNWRGSARRLRQVSGEVEVIAGDVRDAGAVRAAVRGMDCVCHLASVNGTEFFYTRPELA